MAGKTATSVTLTPALAESLQNAQTEFAAAAELARSLVQQAQAAQERAAQARANLQRLLLAAGVPDGKQARFTYGPCTLEWPPDPEPSGE